MVKPDNNKKNYEKYKQKFFIVYMNSKESKLASNETETNDTKNLITVFTGSINSCMQHLPDEELCMLHDNLTCKDEQGFYNWLHKKYDDILKVKGCGAEKRFLFAACALRDLYQGKFDNIGKGGDYAVALLKILEKKEQKENYQELAKEQQFIPEKIINNIATYSVRVYTELYKKAERTHTVDLDILKKIFRENLSNAIEFTAKRTNRKVDVTPSKPSQILGSWTERVKTGNLSSNHRKRPNGENKEDSCQENGSKKSKTVRFREDYSITI